MKDLIKLRELEKKDIAQINIWRNDKEVINHLGNNFSFISERVDELWFENYVQNRDKSVRLAIIDIKTGTYIGNVYLTGIHHINRSAEFSIFIGNKKYWSKGYGYEATMKVLEHGFIDLNLNRIYLSVLDSNERAVNLYKKIGFKKEGILKEAIYKNSRYHDLILMALLKRQFKK